MRAISGCGCPAHELQQDPLPPLGADRLLRWTRSDAQHGLVDVLRFRSVLSAISSHMTKVLPPEAETSLACRANQLIWLTAGGPLSCAPIHDEVLPCQAAALAKHVALQAVGADDAWEPNLWEHYLRGKRRPRWARRVQHLARTDCYMIGQRGGGHCARPRRVAPVGELRSAAKSCLWSRVCARRPLHG